MMYRFDILTVFPGMFLPVLGESILGRAIEKGLIAINPLNIRDFSANKHKKVDDYPYGGGSGMVMTPQPIYDAFRSVSDISGSKPHTVYMSPQGKPLTQLRAGELATEYDHLIILCGHYEGIDERILEEIVDEEISIGDYVLTGGEIPAMALIDCIARLIPGVLSNDDSAIFESHMNGLLEYPQYTRPPVYLNRSVPEILLNGHHAKIAVWRQEQSLKRTRKRRPDMYRKYLRTRAKNN
jgi:tRNA (guanine37-N1)-methyltransferase